MSILGGINQARDKIGAALGDEGAALRLAHAGVRLTRMQPVTASYSRMGGHRGRAASPTAAIAGQGRYGQYGVDVGQHQDQYRHFAGMTYSIIRTIANRIAGQPLHHARRIQGVVPTQRRLSKQYVPVHLKSAEANLETFSDSDVLRAFRNPNPGMVQHTLAFNTISSLELTGKGYWWIRYEEDDDDFDGVGGEPQIWFLPAHWVEPVHTPERLYAKWIIRPGGSGESFEVGPDEMVYFYYPDPSDPLAAYSPLVAMAKTVMADESIEEAVRRSFLNAVAPSFAITIGAPAESQGTGVAMPPPVLSRAQRKALKAILLEEYRGTLNTGMPLILDGFIKAIQNLNVAPRELDFLNSASAIEARLCKGWGINPIVMGHVEGANRASSAVADDHFCHDTETECLTRSGWKRYTELTTDTEVACYEPDTGAVVYHKPEQVVVYDHDGPMCRWSSPQGLDALLTPNHRCWVQTWEKPGQKRRQWSFREAGSLAPTTYYRIKTGGTAVGVMPSESVHFGPVSLGVETFCDLVGWFVSEGHHATKSAGITITQGAGSPHVQTIEELFTNIGLPYTRQPCNDVYQWTIRDTAAPGICTQMREECGGYSHEKKLPERIKGWPARLLARVLDAACDGDARVKSDVTRTYTTTSKQLADDIQEIAVKCGWRAYLTPCEPREDRKPCWRVNLHRTDERTLAGGDRSTEHYTGKVWCVTVPTGLFIVRRGGCVHVSGNCRNVINPRLVMMSQTASCIMPRFFGGRNDEVVFWEPATSTDLDYELELEVAMTARGAMSNNEWRSRHGMAPIKGGDAAMVGGGDGGDSWVVVEGEEQEPDANGQAGAEHDDEPRGPSKPVPSSRPTTAGPNTTKLLTGSVAAELGFKGVMERHDKLQTMYEEKFRDTAAAVLGGLAADFRAKLGRIDPARVDALHARSALDEGYWENSLRTALSPCIQEAALAGAAQEWLLAQSFTTARRLAMGQKGFLPGGLKAKVMQAVRAVLNGDLFRRMIDHVKDRITRTVDKAAKDGLSTALAATEAVASDTALATQAARIAQMESQAAVSIGQSAAYTMLHRAGKVSRRMWKSRRDNRVRPTHDEADGQVAEGMGGFLVGGHSCMFPGDTTLPPDERFGCRCICVTLE